MANLDFGGNYLYVRESAASFTKIGAPYYLALFPGRLPGPYYALHQLLLWEIQPRINKSALFVTNAMQCGKNSQKQGAKWPN